MLKSILSAVVVCCFAVSVSATALAQNVKVEKIESATLSPTNIDVLLGKKDGKPATISGELRIPGSVKGKAPVVLLVHGSGGLGANIHYWVAELNKLGIATFAMDSFTGRGVKNTITDQSLVSNFAMVIDVYRALETLSKHPAVDPDRIAAFGLSMGATHAYFLGAIEPRIARVAHLCCFADLATLIETGAHDLHGHYMTMPSLLAQTSFGHIAGMIAPR